MKKIYCFTVDDNIRLFMDLTDKNYASIFDNPYLSMYKRLHDKYGVKIQLNLFYRYGDFDLSMMTDRYRAEWEQCSDWLKMSFHSEYENDRPYIDSAYREVYEDCKKIHREIVRFAGKLSLGETTTVHYCVATEEGINALRDNGVKGLLGLFGTVEAPRTSYGLEDSYAEKARNGDIVVRDKMNYAAIDIILNRFSKEENLKRLVSLKDRNAVRIMIHEQYFYSDYKNYQKDFEEKLASAFEFLSDSGFSSVFFEEEIRQKN